ncbi:MAG TPA: outer membrane beta-barrel protein [Prolixibacteraceae bacterium]
MKITFLLASVCLFIGLGNLQAHSSSENFQIKGVLKDASTSEGIPYATITVKNSKQAVIKRFASDVNGSFKVYLDSIGNYTLSFQSVGFQSISQPVSLNIKNPKSDLGVIQLKPGSETIGEVSVVGTKPLIRTEVDKIIYSTEADPESTTSNALDMLRKVPLVTVDGEDNIQVKGSSSFKILLNGKNSTMMAQSPRDVLRSMPASSIKDIEVITNPSSKYEAEGTGGIINIITTKKQISGIMANVNTGVDSRGGYNAGLYVSSKIKKFGFSLSGNYGDQKQPNNESYSNGENFLSTSYKYSQSNGTSNFNGKFNYFMGEMSYEIDSLNLISLSFFEYGGNYTSTGVTNSSNSDLNQVVSRQFTNNTITDFGYGSLSGNIDYQRTYKKPEKSFTLSYKLDNSPRNQNNENEVLGILNYSSYKQRSLNDAYGREHTLQVDYYDPLTKVHQIEVGLKYILRQNYSNTIISQYDDVSNIWKEDQTKANKLDYDQHIFGLYAGYLLKLKKISIKTGLRAEGTVNDGYFKSIKDTTFTNRMFNLIPYITLSRNLKSGQNLKLSYTQRLSRPGIWYLNPYVNDLDPLNISCGNPKLNAEISHVIDFTYGKFSSKFNINVSLNGSFANNTIENYVTIYPTGVKISTYDNIGKIRRLATNGYGSLKVGKKLNLNLNLNIAYKIVESSDARNLKNEGFSSQGSMNVRYAAWKNGTISCYGGVYSAEIRLQGKSSPYYYNTFSISQEFLDKKLRLSASISNPFQDKYKNEYTLNDPSFSQTNTSYSFRRQFNFNISYKFGQMKGEIKKARRTIQNDDLKSGGDSNGAGK